MDRGNEALLVDWAIIRATIDGADIAFFHFTGLGFNHPRLTDGVQIVTSPVVDVEPDGAWGKTTSRIYNLHHQLERNAFTSEHAETVREILLQETGVDFDIEWMSIDDWKSSCK